tara:strand:- start:1348 stop:1815 length:468 start_codon:yes stop_codon:yes gene_type:complete
MIKFSQIFSTLFYIGYSKYAPGTIGSFISLIIIYFLKNNLKYIFFVIFFVILLSISFFLIKIFSKKINKYDASEIIIDEFLGVYFIMLFWDFFTYFNEFVNLFMVFILFRLFDISKFFPANYIQNNFKNSFGVIFDDIIAGIYTVIVIILINVVI